VKLSMRAAVILLTLHVLALALGMFGLVSAVPNSAQFAGNPYAMAFYGWAIVNTGTVDILTGALAMLAFGVATLGLGRTLLFFVAATVISASAELTGTKTGWPFGGYEYTGFSRLRTGRARAVHRAPVLVLHGLRIVSAREQDRSADALEK